MTATLQINFAVSDLALLESILPHQLKQLYGQVDEVLFTVDAERNMRTEELQQDAIVAHKKFFDFLDKIASEFKKVRIQCVDYSEEAFNKVSQFFYSGKPAANKDARGKPIYAYLFGLVSAKNNYVLHIDSDMFFGGGSQTWVAEAIALLQRHADVLVCSPLGGPPRPDGRILESALNLGDMSFSLSEKFSHESVAYQFKHISTRAFMIDMQKFRVRAGHLRSRLAPLRDRVRAWVEGHEPNEGAEVSLSRTLSENGLARVDFLGSGAGLWSLHPPYRSDLFYEMLPEIVRRIETGDLPPEQLGFHDIHNCFFDWSEIERANKRKYFWQRIF